LTTAHRFRAGSLTEARLFGAAMALVALHAIDYAFVDREPGTSAGDHLVSGLVVPAIAIALALAYPHARAGLRASLAAGVGLIGLAIGIGTSLRHVLSQGVGGDDLTGILAAIACALVLGMGVLLAWRTRRLDERPLRRYGRRLLVGIVAVLVLYELVYPLALAGIVTHRVGWDVPPANLGAGYQTVRFGAGDGVRLSGWYVPSRNRAAVIVSPGRSAEVQAHVRMLTRHGYGVLVFDRRGEGASEGDFNILGWSGERDLRGAVAFLERRREVDPDRIGGLGLSVGGEMLLQAAAHSAGLHAVVSEGAGRRSIREHMHLSGVAKWQLMPQMAVLTAAVSVLADDAPAPDLAGLSDDIAPRASFFIHARHGLVDEVLNRDYYAHAGRPKARWEIAAGGHTDGLAASAEEYERRVVAFFDRQLLGH
jgi:dienelactone hydrolase